MNPEFADLVPLFVEEARDRIERLATFVPQMEGDAESVVEVKRELHTLKGAGRMLQIAPLAELCHAAEEVLHAAPPGMIPLLTRVVDELSGMVETVSRGDEPGRAADLLDVLLRASAPPVLEDVVAAAPAGGNGSSPEPVPEPVPVPAAEPISTPQSSAPAKPTSLGSDIRVDTSSLDAVAERATQVRIMALAGRQVVERIYELARLAEEGLHEPQPTQVLAVLSTMLRRVAVELEGGQRRLIRASEEQLEKMLGLQLQPLRGSLVSLARHARELARALGREVEVELEGE
ncbi:MAG TPA: Hpt domain-containing protein, partial [Thermoanaerobaculia bacterium]|nr:Hpt domain-containing protein [Thermoanaerobaculia bacterium]